jgi:hypothetical protein
MNVQIVWVLIENNVTFPGNVRKRISINQLKQSKMKKLLKIYGFNSDMQYFEMIVESVINGNREQAKEQFKAMKQEDKIRFVQSIFGAWVSGLSDRDKMLFIKPI